MDGGDKNACPLRNIQTAHPIVAINGKPVNECGMGKNSAAEQVVESKAGAKSTKSAAKATDAGKCPEKATDAE